MSRARSSFYTCAVEAPARRLIQLILRLTAKKLPGRILRAGF